MDYGKGAINSSPSTAEVREMIAEAGTGGTPSAAYEMKPIEGGTLTIPATDAVIINVLLWPGADLNAVTVRLPDALVEGRRIFLYMADGSVGQLSVTAAADVEVRNGVASMNKFDLLVFNTVSMSRKIIARVATS